MKIYEDTAGLMINLDSDSGGIIGSYPKGSLHIVYIGAGLRIDGHNGPITDVLLPSQILDEAGDPWGATIAETRTALNAFFNFASSGGGSASDLWDIWGKGSDYFINNRTKVGDYASVNIPANTLLLYPFLLKGKVTDFGVKVISGPGKIVFAVYDSDAQQKPTNRLWRSLEQNIVGSTDLVFSGLDLNMNGVYWFACLSDSLIKVSGTFGETLNIMGYEFGRVRDYHRYTAALAYVAVPPMPLPTLIPDDTAATGSATLFFKKQ